MIDLIKKGLNVTLYYEELKAREIGINCTRYCTSLATSKASMYSYRTRSGETGKYEVEYYKYEYCSNFYLQEASMPQRSLCLSLVQRRACFQHVALLDTVGACITYRVKLPVGSDCARAGDCGIMWAVKLIL